MHDSLFTDLPGGNSSNPTVVLERGDCVGTWFGLTYTYRGTEDDLNVIAEIYNIAPSEWPEPEAVYPPEK